MIRPIDDKAVQYWKEQGVDINRIYYFDKRLYYLYHRYEEYSIICKGSEYYSDCITTNVIILVKNSEINKMTWVDPYKKHKFLIKNDIGIIVKDRYWGLQKKRYSDFLHVVDDSIWHSDKRKTIEELKRKWCLERGSKLKRILK